MKDYYKILGIERTASAADIRKAYILQLRKYHPDVAGTSPEIIRRMNEITEAYSILGNLQSRLKYSVILNKSVKIPKYLDAEIKYNSRKNKQ